MKVYVENKDKDFLELCLKEHCVYDYIEYDSRYRDKLELVSLADYTKQVRKEVCEEIRGELDKISGEHTVKAKGGIGKFTCVSRYSLEQLLDQIQGE